MPHVTVYTWPASSEQYCSSNTARQSPVVEQTGNVLFNVEPLPGIAVAVVKLGVLVVELPNVPVTA